MQQSTQLSFQTTVTLAMNIFNEKIVTFLDLKGYNDTLIFAKAVTTLQNCINLKSKDNWFLLNHGNEENGKALESTDDKRLGSILQVAEKFKDMYASKSDIVAVLFA